MISDIRAPNATLSPGAARPAARRPDTPGAEPTGPEGAARAAGLRAVATEFEAAFLAQMLQHAGAGRSPEGFGGGAGEDAFASLLTAEHARLMAGSGGIGLADAIFAALVRRDGAGQ